MQATYFEEDLQHMKAALHSSRQPLWRSIGPLVAAASRHPTPRVSDLVAEAGRREGEREHRDILSRPGGRERSEGSAAGGVLDRSESEREMERASCRSPLLFWRCQRQKRRFDRSVERPFKRSPCAAAAASGAPLKSGLTATGRTQRGQRTRRKDQEVSIQLPTPSFIRLW